MSPALLLLWLYERERLCQDLLAVDHGEFVGGVTLQRLRRRHGQGVIVDFCKGFL